MANKYHDDVLDPEDVEAEGVVAEEAAPEQTPAAKLLSFLAIPNLVTELTETELDAIGAKAIEGYELDDRSREDWKERNKRGIELATMSSETKDYPFPGAANVMAPLITTAAIQFQSRAYPAIVKGERVVKVKANGQDPDNQKAKRAERVSEHSSWQMLTQMPEWEPDTDRLTLIVAISGTIFRKRYWDPALGRQCSRLVTAERFVYNYKARSVEDCPRISEELFLYPYEIQERIRDGRFIEFEYGQAQPTDEDEGETDAQSPHKFIEQHCRLDLDEDGYAEPYIVTVHHETRKVCRIVCNFDEESVRVTPEGKVIGARKRDYYTQYVFLPSPDGGAYGMGLGALMGSTTESVNTLINELIDSGNLANTQGGFIAASAGIRERNFQFRKGEFKVVNTSMPLQQAIMPMQFKEPSMVLFQLLGTLMEFAKEISATADVMTGDTGGKAMAPTTTLALIEQGMQVFTAVFKRLHRALARELELHARLNFENLTAEDYNAFFDDQEQQYDPKADYNLKDMNITPVSDPTVATNMQKLAKSQVAREIGTGKPWFNQIELDRRAMEAAEIPDYEELLVPPPQPDPAQVLFEQTLRDLSMQKLVSEINKIDSNRAKDLATALKAIADASAAEAGVQTQDYMTLLKVLETENGMEMQQNAQIPGGPGGVPSMAGAPGDAMGAGPLQGAGPDLGAGGGGIPAGPLPIDPAAMGGSPAPDSAPQGAM